MPVMLRGDDDWVAILGWEAEDDGTTQLIHSDLCGPINQKLLGGSLYFMLLIDDYTKFTAVYFLKKKTEAAACFKN